MKSLRRTRLQTRSTSLAIAALLGLWGNATAADRYWDAAPGTNVWGTASNWSTTSGADSPNPTAAPGGGDRAIFNVNSSQLTISAARAAGEGGDILFDTGAGAYTIGTGAADSQTFVMSTGKNFTMNSGVLNDQLFNIKIHTGGTSSATGSYSFINNSTTNSMTFGGSITAVGGGTKTVAFGGAGLININGAITKGSASSYAITKTGAGSLKINSGGSINSANSGSVTGSITGGGTLDINGGTVRFNGGTFVVGDNTTSGHVIVRAGSTLQLTGAVAIGQGSSGTGNTPVSTFTQYGGATTIGSSSILYLGNYRGATMDIQGGTLTSSSSAIIGIRGNSSLTISGASTAVSFTQIDLGLAAGSLLPTADLNLNGGTLTLGTNGITKGSTDGAKTVSFDGGTLKASATSADFVNADFVYVKTGGATIDTNAFDVTIDNALLQFGATTGALTKSGAGTLRLTATNTYTGGSSVSAGILQFANTAALPTTGAYAATGTGTLAVNAGGGSEFTNATSGAGTIGGFFSGATFASGTAFGIDTTNAGGSLSYAGNFTGTGIGITKLGTGTLTLSGNNTYTGTTTINAGTLQAGSATAFAGGGALVMANATNTFDINGNSFSFSNLTASGGTNNTITTTAAGSGTDTLTITGMTAGSGALFSDNGTRRLAVSVNAPSGTLDPLTNSSNTFSGGLTLVDNIRLAAANNSVTTGGKFGKGTITMGGVAGDTAQLYFSAANVTIQNPFVVNTAATVGSRAGAFRVDSIGNTLSGQIDANLADAVFINGSAANGAITLSGKVTGARGLQVNSNAVGNPLKVTLNNAGTANDFAGNTTVGNFSTLTLGAANQIPNSTGKGNVALNGTLDLNAYSETINGLSGAGTIDNVLATGGASNTLTLGDNNIAIGTGFTGVIKNTAGSLAISKVGSGAMTLSGNNSFSGGLTVGGSGVVTLSHDNAAGTNTIALQSTYAGVNSILVTSGGRTIANNITMDSATGRNNIGNAVGTTALEGNITINNAGANGQIIQNNASDNAVMTIGKADFTSTITAATFANNLSFRGTSTGGGVINSVFTAPSTTFDINGATNWTINSTGNNWGVVTGILAGGNLILGATDALDTGARLDHSGTGGDLDLNGFNQTIAGLNRSGAAIAGAQITNNSATTDSQLTLAGLSQDYTYANEIADGASKKVSLVMNSAGRVQTLSGTNTYTGDTTVKAGTLALGVSGTIADSANIIVGDSGSSGTVLDVSAKTGGFTIGATQTLSGIGTVDANDGTNKYDVTILGTHAAGNNPGSQTIDGNLTYSGASAIFAWDLNATNGTDPGVVANAGTYDQVTVTGDLDGSGATFKVILGANAFSNAFWDTDKSWTDIFTVSGAATNLETIFTTVKWFENTTDMTASTASRGSFTISGSSLTWTAVPEPTSALAGLLLGAGLLRRRRQA